MGAPPGIGSKTSAPPPQTGEHSTVDAPSPGPAAPPQGPTVTAQFVQQADTPLGPDEIRLRLAKGFRLFSDNHLDTAKSTLQPVSEEKVAQTVLNKIENRETRFHALQFGAVLRALGQDNASEKGYSDFEKTKLDEAIQEIETQLLTQDGKPWAPTLERAKKGFSAETLKVWERFALEQNLLLQEIEGLFQEKDRELMAVGLLQLAERCREKKYFGASWTLAQLATEFPETQEKAKALIGYLEGRRTSTEYIISDMFDQGGSSMAINLLSLLPAVAGARRLSQSSRLLAMPLWKRAPLTLLAGGSLHWASTKGLMAASGYDGQIMPRSWGEFGVEFSSSTAQAGLALLLANRFWKVKPPVAKAAAETEVAAASTFRQKALAGLARGGKGLWWTTKTGLKVSTVTAGDLATQWAFHASGVKDMTPRGLPQGLVKTFFPSTYESRQTVISTYEARRLFELHRSSLASAEAGSEDKRLLEPGLNLELFLTQLDPSLDGERREMAYAALVEGALQKKLGLNIRRWVLNKVQTKEFAGANKTLERQGLPLRFDEAGAICFTDSLQYPCPGPAVETGPK